MLAPGDGRFGDRLGRLEEVVRSSATPLGGWEHAGVLARLSGKMDHRPARDPGCKVYETRVHRYRLAPPLAEVDLLGLERRLGFLMPSEYRAFVVRLCNGPIGPGYGLEPLPADAAVEELAQVCPLTDADAPIAQMQSADLDWPALPGSLPGTLYLVNTGGGGAALLVLTGQQRGKVWASGDEFTGPAGDLGDYTPQGFFAWYEDWLGS